jgi:hypothetical protein
MSSGEQTFTSAIIARGSECNRIFSTLIEPLHCEVCRVHPGTGVEFESMKIACSEVLYPLTMADWNGYDQLTATENEFCG